MWATFSCCRAASSSTGSAQAPSAWSRLCTHTHNNTVVPTHLNKLTDGKCLRIFKAEGKSKKVSTRDSSKLVKAYVCVRVCVCVSVKGGLTSPAGQRKGCLCWRRASGTGFPSSSLGATRPAGFSSSSPTAPRHSSSFCPPLAPQTPSDPLHSWDDPVQDKTLFLFFYISFNSGSLVFCFTSFLSKSKVSQKVIADFPSNLQSYPENNSWLPDLSSFAWQNCQCTSGIKN